jgi:Uma2 family endonuclease
MDSETFTPMTPQPTSAMPLATGQSQEFYLAPDEIPCLDHLVTEDDTPVDSLYSAYQQKLLTEPLNTSWAGPGEGRPFLTASNVGLFYAVAKPPIVPDTMLSLDVELPADPWPKQNRSYFIWVMGKPPDAVIEIVSNREGDEDTRKLRLYAQLGIAYYVIWDPERYLSTEALRLFSLSGNHYVPLVGSVMTDIGLGVTPWQGTFEKWTHTWLRWCDVAGTIIPTGAERAERERQRADRLAAQLRSLGVEPEAGA